MGCSDCESENSFKIPFVVHEAAMARAERHMKRQTWLIGVLIALLVATNAAWLWYESQFEYVETTTQTVTQDAETGNNSFVGCDYYG